MLNKATVKGIEESDAFFAIITPSWLAEPVHRDEIAYAKALNKPFALAIEDGIDVGNMFEGCDIIEVVTFSQDWLFDKSHPKSRELDKWLAKVRNTLERRKGTNRSN